MMNVKEKLVELLDIIIQPGQKTLQDIADHLIANGVTFAEDTNVPDKMDFCGELCNFSEGIINRLKKEIEKLQGELNVEKTRRENAVNAYNELRTNGVTVQEQNKEGCPYCDIAKANEGVINKKLWVKEAETNRWTMMGERLNFCPMCGRRLPEPPKGE